MTFSPVRKNQHETTIADWPKTPFSSKTSSIGVVMASEWGNTISYEFDLSPFADQSSNILEDLPSVFDTPSRFQSNMTDFHSSQNTSARTSLSPNFSPFPLQENENLFNVGEKKDFTLHREVEGECTSYSSLDTSRGTSSFPSPSPSKEDGMEYLSVKSPNYSYAKEEHIQHSSQNNLTHLHPRKDEIVDPLNLTQTTMIPAVVLPRNDSACDENKSHMLPSIVSRKPSPEENRPMILLEKQEYLYENGNPAASSNPVTFSHDSGMYSVFDFPQEPNHFTFSSKAVEIDGWISFWPPVEEKKGKSKKGKGKAMTLLKSGTPYLHENRFHKNEELARKNFNETNGKHQVKVEETQLQWDLTRGQCFESNQERKFIEIKTQFQTIPEHCDPNRFSDNGRCLIACEACKRRKMRCTNEYPTCSNCQRRNSTCQYAQKVGTRGKSKRSSINQEEFIRSSKRGFRLDHTSSQPPLKYRKRSDSQIQTQ